VRERPAGQVQSCSECGDDVERRIDSGALVKTDAQAPANVVVVIFERWGSKRSGVVIILRARWRRAGVVPSSSSFACEHDATSSRARLVMNTKLNPDLWMRMRGGAGERL
jgi:hypothetical protein